MGRWSAQAELLNLLQGGSHGPQQRCSVPSSSCSFLRCESPYGAAIKLSPQTSCGILGIVEIDALEALNDEPPCGFSNYLLQ